MSRKEQTISSRLTTVRKRTGLSQAAFGEKLGISDRAYKNYELEIRDLPSSVAKTINAEFGINIHWLFTGEGFIDAMTQGEIIETAVIETRAFFIEQGITVDPEKEAKVIRYLIEQIQENGSISEELKLNFFKAVS